MPSYPSCLLSTRVCDSLTALPSHLFSSFPIPQHPSSSSTHPKRPHSQHQNFSLGPAFHKVAPAFLFSNRPVISLYFLHIHCFLPTFPLTLFRHKPATAVNASLSLSYQYLTILRQPHLQHILSLSADATWVRENGRFLCQVEFRLLPSVSLISYSLTILVGVSCSLHRSIVESTSTQSYWTTRSFFSSTFNRPLSD
ncbi:uncharacterized protein LY79DRAFT_257762 [Colletotrichum navitas]|uniref:Uncharacterized protein n=1 Tax=Colletotrichum navitas TaxID=681940 RepID=A0AAD8PX92_9PEZI|nr:uncharacterized protein LY79DRAFT_257762 [Colletotrichum navitas]KAK1585853.1 hypothetical protein LY79DRAFT_257762 [Colletotrichum navitas]